MTIVQQPDSLSFCGNLKDFIITGESELSFLVKKLLNNNLLSACRIPMFLYKQGVYWILMHISETQLYLSE